MHRRRKVKITKLPPGPEWSWLRFQRYQFDPRIPRHANGVAPVADQLTQEEMGHGPKSWDWGVDLGESRK